MDAEARADAIERVVRSLSDVSLRADYFVSLFESLETEPLARALDVLCTRAEQAEDPAREVLASLVDALNTPGVRGIVQRLREQAVGESLLALERLVRQPVGPSRAPTITAEPDDQRVPDYGTGRPLTLGERKSLARRPDRNMLERLLLDPHPDVIGRLLRNPRLTEDDVVRLAARRPARPEIQSEIARSTKWVHRARVRMALILNPDTPVEIAGPISGLLVRQELRLVVESTHVSPSVRALCLEHLERRPPGEDGPAGQPVQ